MQHLQADKAFVVTPPAAIVDNDVFVTNTIDTLGFGELLLIVVLGATDVALAALKLRESESADMSGATDVSGADFSVSPATLPGASDDNNLFMVHVRCGGPRKRYFDLTATGGNGSTGAFLTCVALLSKGKNVPTTNAQRGATQALSV